MNEQFFADNLERLEGLRSAMMKGGVEVSPDIWFTEDIEQTAY